MTENGYKKCQSDNIARVDSLMIASYFSTNDTFLRAEMRGVKASRSCRESYGDAAVGYVQVKRAKHMCFLKARICPEHRVRQKGYAVSLIVNEKDNEIVSVECFDCAASKGGCKHAVAFLMWVHRRSEEPAPTEVVCYWKKSKLSKVGTSLKYVEAKSFGGGQQLHQNTSDSSFIQEFIARGLANSSQSQLLKHLVPLDPIESLSIDQLLYDFQEQGGDMKNATDFFVFASNKMSSFDLSSATIKTQDQSNSSLWFRLRYGRITASKLFEVSRCKTPDGCLVEAILGAKKFKATKQMQRGIALEPQVIKVVEAIEGQKLQQVGLTLNDLYPILGASPDSISVDSVYEIKCPSSSKTVTNYVKDNVIAPKYLAQMHLQMLFAKKSKAKFCVAQHDFETSRVVNVYVVKYNKSFADEVIANAIAFWKQNIFPFMVNNMK